MSGDEKLSVHEALARVMAELPAIGKDQQASAQQGGYAYRGIEQITKHAQGLFARHGVVIVPNVQSVEVREITVNGKPWTDTTLVVNYTLVGPDGSKLSATTIGIGRDNADKGANKAMTQAFKYLLLQVLCISDAKDDGDAQTHEADAREPEHPNANRVRKVMAALGQLSEAQREAFKVWKGDRQATGRALLADETWLENLENWLDEKAHEQAEQGVLV